MMESTSDSVLSEYWRVNKDSHTSREENGDVGDQIINE